MDEEIQLQDKRRHGFFIVDNDVFHKDRKISAMALLVYCVLCRIAKGDDPELSARRSYIAKIARISTGAVSNATSELVEIGLITVESQRSGRTNKPSLYTLLPIPSRSKDVGHVTTDTTQPHRERHTSEKDKERDIHVEVPSTDVLDLFSESEPPEKSETIGERVERAVKTLFAKYVDLCDRDPVRYTLLPSRMKKGKDRFMECLHKTSEPGSTITNENWQQAGEMFLDAIHALAASPFHNGQNTQKVKYNDWIDNLCKSPEEFEKWLEKGGR